MQYVIRQPHATNPRLAAEALRNRRPAPPPEWEEMARLQVGARVARKGRDRVLASWLVATDRAWFSVAVHPQAALR
jgi:hypothetical protein